MEETRGEKIERLRKLIGAPEYEVHQITNASGDRGIFLADKALDDTLRKLEKGFELAREWRALREEMKHAGIDRDLIT